MKRAVCLLSGGLDSATCLALARRVAEGSGGRLDIDSAPGHGTAVRLRLQALCRLGWRQRIFNQQDRRRSSGHRRGLDCHRPVRPCLRC